MSITKPYIDIKLSIALIQMWSEQTINEILEDVQSISKRHLCLFL